MKIDDSLLESVVIVQASRGFVAYIRFSDSRLNEDISATNHWQIHKLVDRAVYRKLQQAPRVRHSQRVVLPHNY